jgi:hypothetical protein
LITLFSTTGPLRDTEVAEWLAAKDRGIRLAAYAYLDTRPKVELTDVLSYSALKEDKPFGQ